jgi:KipI family sensor histidine kinase inhibitor
MNLYRYGESGIRIVFGNSIDLETHEKVRRYYYFLKSLRLKEFIDIIPSFNSCVINFNNNAISFENIVSLITERHGELDAIEIPQPAHHEIPVMYGGECGPDMEFVCEYSGLSDNEVIEIHTSVIYTVFTVGFMPGFPYLGTLDKRLYAPRLETPRLKVPEGSVGLAQLQTGIYPFESPAGWRIIGKTDKKLFDYKKEPYSLLQIGDKVRFIKI